jgi:hypothetical protein
MKNLAVEMDIYIYGEVEAVQGWTRLPSSGQRQWKVTVYKVVECELKNARLLHWQGVAGQEKVALMGMLV